MAENLLLKNGIAAYNEKRYSDALKYFRKLQEEGKETFDAWYYLGTTYTRIGDLQNALESFRKLVPMKLAKDVAVRLRMIIGYIYSLKENFPLSKEIFLSAHKIEPENPQILSALGYVCYKMDDSKNAQKYLKKALKLDKDNTNALNSLGYIYAVTEDKFDQAVRECEKALHLKPGYPAYLDSLGWAYFKAGNLPKAKKFLAEALEKLPENKDVKNHFKDVVLKEMTWKKRDKMD